MINNFSTSSQSNKLPKGEQPKKTLCHLDSDIALRPGQICPYCGLGHIEYDSLLNLVCSKCGRAETGAST